LKENHSLQMFEENVEQKEHESNAKEKEHERNEEEKEHERDGGKEGKERKQRGPINHRPRAMWMAMWMGLLLWSGTGVEVLAQNPDRAIPASLNCDGDCPGVGTSETGWRQLVSPVTNECTGTALQLILHRLEIEVFLQPDLCPIWVIIEPAHRVPTTVAGCCLLSQQSLPVMRQSLRCECTRMFIICWDHDCLPQGEAIEISEQISWVASPCAGGTLTEPCNQRSK
jgi:hypothetical protein